MSPIFIIFKKIMSKVILKSDFTTITFHCLWDLCEEEIILYNQMHRDWNEVCQFSKVRVGLSPNQLFFVPTTRKSDSIINCVFQKTFAIHNKHFAMAHIKSIQPHKKEY